MFSSSRYMLISQSLSVVLLLILCVLLLITENVSFVNKFKFSFPRFYSNLRCTVLFDKYEMNSSSKDDKIKEKTFMVSRSEHKPYPLSTFQQFVPKVADSRMLITQAYRRHESEAVSWLMTQIDNLPNWIEDTEITARQFIKGIKQHQRQASGVEALLREFSLSSEEGIALMCLAESLLRIPDRQTADRLIADKVSKGAWRRHLGNSSSVFVNFATWGLLVTGKMVNQKQKKGMSAVLTKLISKGGEPLIRKSMDVAMRMLGNQFIKGQHMADALQNSIEYEKRGYRYTYDMLGESALTEKDAAQHCQSYEDAIHAIGQVSHGKDIYDGPGISIKLSALHPRYSYAQRTRVMQELLPKIKQLVLLAKHYDVSLVIDAEEADKLDLSLDIMAALLSDKALAGFDGLGMVVQAYQKRSPFVIDYLVELAKKNHRKLMVRLVKGAYWDTEIKRAQVDGLEDYPVYTRKAYTDLSYLVCAQRLLKVTDNIYPQFATHNAHTVSAIWHWAKAHEVTHYEFQCLHGMGESLYQQVVGQSGFGPLCRIYAPVGKHNALLPYLMRRLLENGANTSFVNQVADHHIDVEQLIVHPVMSVKNYQGESHPKIPLPRNLYGKERLNSAGIDLTNVTMLDWLGQHFKIFSKTKWHAKPLLAITSQAKATRQIHNPAYHADIVGKVTDANQQDVYDAVTEASKAAKSWSQKLVSHRHKILLHAADLFEANMPEWLALLVRESGKTLPNAIAEVRETVDFLRYYSMQIAHQSTAESNGLGPVVCISPWNFPLALFVGEVAAALAAGNTVLAKAAAQTSLIAYRATMLLHEAGVPRQVLQFLPGHGETVGDMLIHDARIKGVVFTGSLDVARHISQQLAKHIYGDQTEIPFIAETGGLNAMIVDSSALPEQVVQDVLASAFDSAGQRCSALRVLCLQEEVADHIMTMLWGAMQELQIGPPDQLATDIGPVIDAHAQYQLIMYIENMRQQGHTVLQMPLPFSCESGAFVPPTLIEIKTMHQLHQEVFGPVLHVLRYKRGQLKQLLESINATGYGLTLGVHSRIDETIDYVSEHADVGNIYVNRNMIGAIVGVQPFGGGGKSGTGPKSGGPLYLARLQQHVMPALSTNEEDNPNELLNILLSWAAKTGHDRLIKLADYYKQHGLLHRMLYLPGPTGEENTLSFLPKGKIGCVATNKASLFNQLVAILVTGNTPVVQMNMVSHIVASLPGKVRAAIQETDCLQLPDLKMMLVESALAEKWAIPLSMREGAIVPMISVTNELPIPLWRLIAERTLSINTTASGGNASLISLES